MSSTIAAPKMLESLRPNPDWASLPLFDRSEWKRVRFGDVVENCNETCDPETAGVDRFIAMEHLEPGSLHVRSWGDVAEGTTFTRRCRPGQVLFGKRRAYQRKIAVAEFEAVVSGDIYVLTPKDERLLPELLPFLCLSERFFQHAVGTSAGSLSPRTNWRSLASYEFDLPPLDQQRHIAEILWAADESEQSRWSVKGNLEALKLAYEVAVFDKLFDEVSVGQIKAAKLRNVLITPICNGIFKTSDLFGKGTLLVNVTDIYSGFRAVPSSLKRVEVTQSESQRFSANTGDVIFNRSSLVLAGIGHACLVPEWDEDMVFECHLMRARPDPQIIDSRFMCRYALSPRGRRFLMSRAQTTTMTTINQGDIGDMQFPLPELERQRAIADHLDDLESKIAEVNRAIDLDGSLKRKFANQLFS